MTPEPPDQPTEFLLAGAVFKLRVVGVALDEGRVLIHRQDGDGFWMLPGGRGELFEPSTRTLEREMSEELGVKVTLGRLLWVVEDFFDNKGRSWHEIALYYLMTIPDSWEHANAQASWPGIEPDEHLTYRWVSLDHIDEPIEGMWLFPSFLRTALRSTPTAITHVVHTDDERPSL